jgi:hypothetical protein
VPSLWELLKIPEKRATNFWVGNREFDAINVGLSPIKDCLNLVCTKQALLLYSLAIQIEGMFMEQT